MKLAILASAALSFVASNKSADACGGYIPELAVYRVATHGLHGARTFVLFGRDERDDVAFTPVDEMSYDSTSVAPLPALAMDWPMTLVGSAGTAKVTSRKMVLVRNDYMFTDGKQRSALEIPAMKKRDFAIALAGAHRDVTWRDAKTFGDYTDDLDLGNGFIVSAEYTDGHYTSTIHKDDVDYGKAMGRALGTLTADGATYIVFDDRGATRARKVLGI